MIKDNLKILFASGALTIGLTTAAHASFPRGVQAESETPATAGPSDEADAKVEEHIIIAAGEADGEADGEAPVKQEERHVIVRTGGGGTGGGGAVVIGTDEPRTQQKKIIVRSFGGGGFGESTAGKEVAWLGVATEEPPDALTAQLDLQPGEGLLVTFVATNSPAAKAGLQKNDLLVEMDGQKLVLPAQLRKLVHMRKEGDPASLTYYRRGKKETTSATLGKTHESVGVFGGSSNLDSLKQFRFQLKDLSSADGLNGHLKELHEAMARAGVNGENIQVEVRRGVDQARKAIAEAMAQVHENRGSSRPTPKALEELARSGVEVDKDATVTIKSRKDSVRTMVKTDDTGTCVIVANPKKRLTAHDKDGKLVFDGEIETSEQQAKVPKDVWKKVQSMIEQMNQSKDDAPAMEDPAPKKTSTLPAGNLGFNYSRMVADLRTLAAMLQYLMEPERTLARTQGTNRLAIGYSEGSGV